MNKPAFMKVWCVVLVAVAALGFTYWSELDAARAKTSTKVCVAAALLCLVCGAMIRNKQTK